jgi:3-hydroxyacyl-CoA dehydrogenase
LTKAAGEALRGGRSRPQLVAAIEAVKWAEGIPFKEALAKETRRVSDVAHEQRGCSLRHLFFAERQAAKVDGLEA